MVTISAFDTLQDGLQSSIGEVTSFVAEHPVGVAAGAVGAVALGAGIVALASSRTKRKAKKKTRKGYKRDRIFKSKQKHERRYKRKKKYKIYGKKGWVHPKRRSRKGSSRRGTHYTKNGQPYIILASGKARFIKKTKRRHKK